MLTVPSRLNFRFKTILQPTALRPFGSGTNFQVPMSINASHEGMRGVLYLQHCEIWRRTSSVTKLDAPPLSTLPPPPYPAWRASRVSGVSPARTPGWPLAHPRHNLPPTFSITNESAPYNDQQQNGSPGQVGNRRPTNRKGGPLLIKGWWGGLWGGLALGGVPRNR